MSYYIVEHDGKVHQIIDKKGKPNKYGGPKIFETMGAVAAHTAACRTTMKLKR